MTSYKEQTIIPTKLAHDIVARLCQDVDTTARELRAQLVARLCQDVDGAVPTGHGLSVVQLHDAEPDTEQDTEPDTEPDTGLGTWLTCAPIVADESEPVQPTGLLTLEIFADGYHAKTWHSTRQPHEREIIVLAGHRYRVEHIEWRAEDIVHVHTQTMLYLPPILDDDGGAF